MEICAQTPPRRLGHDELRKLYWIENKTLKQIAQLYGVTKQTVIWWMDKHGIARRDRETAAKLRRKPFADRDELFRLYWTEKKTIKQIALIYGTHREVVARWMDRYGIARRNRDVISELMRKPLGTREELHKLYWIDNMSLGQIARMYGVTTPTVIRRMKMYGIARRDRSTARKLAVSPEARIMASMRSRRKIHTNPGPIQAYTLGVLFGDGYVFVQHKPSSGKRSYQVGLHVKDRLFADEFAEALRNIGLNPWIYTDRKGFHYVHATSANFYDWCKSFYLDGKSPDIKRLRSFIEGFELHFVRGFYESEGSISKHKTGELRIRMANKCVELLKMVRDILASWGIDSRLYGNDFFTLSVYGTERVNRLLSVIRPGIKTKPRQCLKALDIEGSKL